MNPEVLELAGESQRAGPKGCLPGESQGQRPLELWPHGDSDLWDLGMGKMGACVSCKEKLSRGGGEAVLGSGALCS